MQLFLRLFFYFNNNWSPAVAERPRDACTDNLYSLEYKNK